MDGIADLRANREAYFAEFERDDVRALLREADDDLDNALSRLLRRTRSPAHLGQYIMSHGRAGWRFLLPTSRDTTVLDLGCGWGTLAYSLAKCHERVVAMDSTLERMQLLQRRAERDGLTNLQLICAGDRRYLPFDDGTFDLVVINGVLEWVPIGTPGDPEEVQRQFLREVRRVLRPGGTLYLGIENRYAWKTWFRNRDGHANLRYVPWLPRPLADLYSRLNGKGGYRTYLYSHRGYNALLRTAGFDHVRTYVPLPGYHHPNKMVPLDDGRALRRASMRPEQSPGARLKQTVKSHFASRFPDSFGVVGTVGPVHPSFIQRLCAAMAKADGDHVSLESQVASYRINSDMGMVTLLLRDTHGVGGRDCVVKIALHERAADELAHEAMQLKKVGDASHPLAPIRRYLPRVLAAAEFEGHTYTAYGRLPGAPAEELAKRCVDPIRVLDQLADFAVQLHLRTVRKQPTSSDTFRADLMDHLACVGQLSEQPSHQRVLKRLAAALPERMALLPAGSVLGHGDFKIANGLLDSGTYELSGIVDWGRGFEQELPLYDLSFLMVDYRWRFGGGSLVDALGEWAVEGKLEPVLDHRFQRWLEQMSMPRDGSLVSTLGLYQWVKRMAPLAGGQEAKRFDYRYIDEMFDLLTQADIDG